MTRLLTRLRRDESGFTLIEVLLVSAMLVVILGAIAGLATTAERMTPVANESALHLVEAQTGLDRMVREIRSGHNVAAGSSPAAVTFDVRQRSDGVTTQVTYDCNAAHPAGGALRRCVRRVAGAEEVVVDRVVNADVGKPIFSYAVQEGVADSEETEGEAETEGEEETVSAPHINYVEVAVVVPGRGERQQGPGYRTTLEDAAYLRNVDVLHP